MSRLGLVMLLTLGFITGVHAQLMGAYYSAADSILYIQYPSTAVYGYYTLRIRDGGATIEQAPDSAPGATFLSDGIPGHIFALKEYPSIDRHLFLSTDYGNTWNQIEAIPRRGRYSRDGRSGLLPGQGTLVSDDAVPWIYLTSDSWQTYDSLLFNGWLPDSTEAVYFSDITYESGVVRGLLLDGTLCVSSDTTRTWAIGSRFDHHFSTRQTGARDELWCALWPDSEVFLVTDTGRTVLDSVFIFHLPTRIYNWNMMLRATNNPGEAYVFASIDYWTYPIRTELFVYHIQQYGAVVDTFYHELYNYHVATARDVLPLPSGYAICAFPNPFNSSVTLQWNAPGPLPVHVTIWDLLGRTVWSWRGPGDHVIWDGRSDRGVLLSSGTYFVRIEGPMASPSTVLPIVLLR